MIEKRAINNTEKGIETVLRALEGSERNIWGYPVDLDTEPSSSCCKATRSHAKKRYNSSLTRLNPRPFHYILHSSLPIVVPGYR
jgi:hypothetical protein